MPAIPTGRETAQQRADRIRAFRTEVQVLRAEGVEPFSPELERGVLSHHDAMLAQFAARFDVDVTDRAGQLSRGMRIASFFGALTLSAAIYALVGRFWGALTLPLQIGVLTLFPVAALAGVDLAARRDPSLYVASIFAAVAYATFWLAAVVSTRVLDLPLTPHVLWMGAAFGLALALGYGFRVVLVAALLALVAAFAATFFSIAGAPWTTAASQIEPAMMAAFGLLFLAPGLDAAVPGFGVITRRVALVAGFSALLALSVSGDVSLWPWSARWLEAGYQLLTLIVCAVSILIGLKWRMPDVATIGAVALALFLIARSVDWFWSMLPRYVFFLILAAAAFGWLVALQRSRSRLGDR